MAQDRFRAPISSPFCLICIFSTVSLLGILHDGSSKQRKRRRLQRKSERMNLEYLKRNNYAAFSKCKSGRRKYRLLAMWWMWHLTQVLRLLRVIELEALRSQVLTSTTRLLISMTFQQRQSATISYRHLGDKSCGITT